MGTGGTSVLWGWIAGLSPWAMAHRGLSLPLPGKDPSKQYPAGSAQQKGAPFILHKGALLPASLWAQWDLWWQAHGSLEPPNPFLVPSPALSHPGADDPDLPAKPRSPHFEKEPPLCLL